MFVQLSVPFIAKILIMQATLFLSVYFLLLNHISKHILKIYFGIHFLTYASIILLFLFEDVFIRLSSHPLKTIMFDFTYTNFPLYMLSSCCLIGSYSLLEFLTNHYPITQIIALSQLSILFTTIGYHFLGDRMSIASFIAIMIILIGSLITGLTHFSLKEPKSILKQYNKKLIAWCLLTSILIAIPAIITYICTAYYDPITQNILHTLTKHTHGIPFAPVIPLYMNIGVQCFNLVLLLIWILYRSTKPIDLLNFLVLNKKIILGLALLHIGYIYCYYSVFDMIENKNIISGIVQLYLPLTMICSTFIYHQKWNKFEIAGMSIIAIGSILSAIS